MIVCVLVLVVMVYCDGFMYVWCFEMYFFVIVLIFEYVVFFFLYDCIVEGLNI